ncbi:MAG: MFS transporter [Dehalococcoidia bacterium]|nr:MFS transporter [Dehalococcoidia bacterium]
MQLRTNSRHRSSAASAPPEAPAPSHAETPEITTEARSAGPRGWRRTFTALSERDYAVYFGGNLAFFLAMQMDQLMRGYYALELTGAASALGLVAVSSAVPMLLVSAFGGVVADRYSKRKVLLLTQALVTIVNAVFAAMIIAGVVEFWHLLVGAVLQGVMMSIVMPVRQAMVTQLVPRHKLMNAVSLQMSGMNLTRVIGPVIAGLIIAPFGLGVTWWVAVALYAVATVSIVLLPAHGMTALRARGSVLAELGGGFAYIWRTPLMRLLLLTAMLMPLFAFPVQLVLPVFAKDVFDDGATGLAVLMAGAGVGGLIGSLLTASLDAVQHKGRVMLVGGIAQGVLFIAFALTPFFVPAVALLALANIGGMLFMTTNNATIQARVPEEYRGRVMSVLMMSFGIMPLGVVPMTLLADGIGAPYAVALTSAIMLATIALVFAASTQLRTLRVAPGRHAELSPAQAAALVAQGRVSQQQADAMSGVGGEG